VSGRSKVLTYSYLRNLVDVLFLQLKGSADFDFAIPDLYMVWSYHSRAAIKVVERSAVYMPYVQDFKSLRSELEE